MAQAGVWSADKRLKNPDFSGCGAPWRESRRFQVPFLAPKNPLGSGLNAHFSGGSFFLFRPFGVYLVLIDVKKGPPANNRQAPLYLPRVRGYLIPYVSALPGYWEV